MSVVGLDIGYSNIKVAVGPAESARPELVKVFPAGVGPVSELPQTIGGEPDVPTGAVFVEAGEGEEWIAGVEPYRLQGASRELHGDYVRTEAYQALIRAALSFVPGERVSHLVTGLPVKQRADPKWVQEVREAMTGRHELGNGRVVTVDKVTVMSQPSGAFLDFARNTDELALLDKGLILSLDPGFYTTDWVLIEDSDVRHASSGNSTHAISELLDRLDRRVQDRYGAKLGPDRLEHALRTGDNVIIARGHSIDISDDINEIAGDVATRAMSELGRSMRHEQRTIDAVLLSGGGAGRYVEPARRAFGTDVRVIVPDNPVAANARGFWYFAA